MTGSYPPPPKTPPADYYTSWYTVPAEVQLFGQALVSAGIFTTAQEVMDYWEKPHKWDPEHDIWHYLQRPGPDNASWELFVRKVEKALDG
jgi:hypothetical protein